ncbi:hypothetical protein GS531_23080 [Rhodococcus hoagii]|nr:hypothetical protein [Prescottella equi]
MVRIRSETEAIYGQHEGCVGIRSDQHGGLAGAPNDNDVAKALAAGARDRGIDPNQASDQLDASRDVIIDDVIHGVVGGLRRGDAWTIEGDALYAVWDGMPLESLVAHLK